MHRTPGSARRRAVTAVVPLKALDTAKGRLADALSPAQRRELVAWMLGRVVTACVEAEAVGRVLVVAGDDAAGNLAERAGVEVLVEPRPGLARALATADGHVDQAGPCLVVAADLPLAEPGDIDAVCATVTTPTGAGAPTVTVAPTVDGGTGVLLRQPVDVIVPAYGPGSAARHRTLAAAAGARYRTVHRPGLAWDVDTRQGLRIVGRHDPHVRRWLPAPGEPGR